MARKRLIEGVRMRCPRCEQLFPILSFIPLEEIEEYSQETTPIYKCPRKLNGCGFLFAPVEREPTRIFAR